MIIQTQIYSCRENVRENISMISCQLDISVFEPLDGGVWIGLAQLLPDGLGGDGLVLMIPSEVK